MSHTSSLLYVIAGLFVFMAIALSPRVYDYVKARKLIRQIKERPILFRIGEHTICPGVIVPQPFLLAYVFYNSGNNSTYYLSGRQVMDKFIRLMKEDDFSPEELEKFPSSTLAMPVSNDADDLSSLARPIPFPERG